MLHSIVLLVIAFCVIYTSCNDDLYVVLGVKRTATVQEIKKAYRQKAKDTHPDKNPGVDPDVAAERFRKVADAYEVLSDVNARKNYDRTGRTGSNGNQRNGGQQNDGRRGSGFWDFHSNFNFGQRRQQQQQRKGHRYLYDYYLRIQIKDAQSRLLTITGLNHLKFIALDENDVADRYVY